MAGGRGLLVGGLVAMNKPNNDAAVNISWNCGIGHLASYDDWVTFSGNVFG